MIITFLMIKLHFGGNPSFNCRVIKEIHTWINYCLQFITQRQKCGQNKLVLPPLFNCVKTKHNLNIHVSFGTWNQGYAYCLKLSLNLSWIKKSSVLPSFVVLNSDLEFRGPEAKMSPDLMSASLFLLQGNPFYLLIAMLDISQEDSEGPQVS